MRLHGAPYTLKYVVYWRYVRAPSLQVVRCKNRVLTSIWFFGRQTTKCYARTRSRLLDVANCMYRIFIINQTKSYDLQLLLVISRMEDLGLRLVSRPLERQAPLLDQQFCVIVSQHDAWLTIKSNSSYGRAIISSPNHHGTSGSRMRNTQLHIKRIDRVPKSTKLYQTASENSIRGLINYC